MVIIGTTAGSIHVSVIPREGVERLLLGLLLDLGNRLLVIPREGVERFGLRIEKIVIHETHSVIPREGVESIYEYVEETKVLDEM